MKMKRIFAIAALAFFLLTSQVFAVTYYGVSPYPKFKAYAPGTSTPLVGGYLYTCVVGTACAHTFPAPPPFPQVTYTDALGGGTNTNPVILDGNGEADVWLPTYTKLALYDSAGVNVWTIDNVLSALGGTVVATGAELDAAADNTKFASAKALKDSHNVPSVVPGAAGNILASNGTDWISTLVALSDMQQLINNLSFTATVAAKVLTVALKGKDGNNPSPTNIVSIAFRSATLTDGKPVFGTVTGALSVSLDSGGTLGFTSAEAGRLYVWAINNSGTIELALSRTADIFPEGNLVTTVAINSGSDLSTTMYSTAARANVAYRCIGYIEITTGAVAGEWDNAPTKLQVMGPGIKRTGETVQIVSTTLTTTFTASPGANTFVDVTGLAATIPMTSACNKVLIVTSISLGGNNTVIFTAIKRAATLIRVGDVAGSRLQVGTGTQTIASTIMQEGNQTHLDSPATAGAVTYQVQIAPANNAQVCVNRTNTDTDAAGWPRGASNIMVMEIMQ